MLFFRKRNHRTRLGELLMDSGSIWKAGSDGKVKHPRSLDDVYGLTDEPVRDPKPGERVGLPFTGKRKLS